MIEQNQLLTLARISHSPSTATAQLHTMTRFHSVQALDIVSTMPAHFSVVKTLEPSRYEVL